MTVEEILRRKIEEMEETISGLTKQNVEYKNFIMITVESFQTIGLVSVEIG